MQFLLDSYAWVWFLTKDKKLPSVVRSLIEDKSNSCMIRDAAKSGFGSLPLTQPHLLLLTTLDHYHSDPFDRIIIAQAIYEDVTVITKDTEFKKYPIKVIWK